MNSAVKLFLSGMAGAAITYAAAHLSGIIGDPMIVSIVAGVLVSLGHALPSPVASVNVVSK